MCVRACVRVRVRVPHLHILVQWGNTSVCVKDIKSTGDKVSATVNDARVHANYTCLGSDVHLFSQVHPL